MDPVTIIGIVSAVGGLMTTASKALIGCKSLTQKYDDAPKVIALLEEECKVTKAALAFIQDYLEANQFSLSRRLRGPSNPFSDLIHVALTGSTTTFGMLMGEMQSTYSSETVLDDYKAKQRVSVIWNEQALVTLVERMRSVKGTLDLLLSVLQTESLQEIQRKLERDAAMVDSVRQTIGDGNPSSHETARTSLFTGITGDDREFDFDNLIVTSKVYREAMKFNRRKRHGSGHHEPQEGLHLDQEPEAPPAPEPKPAVTFVDIAEVGKFGHRTWDSRATTLKEQRRPSLGYSSDGSDVAEQNSIYKYGKRRSLSSRWQDSFGRWSWRTDRPKRNSEPAVPSLKGRLYRTRSDEQSLTPQRSITPIMVPVHASDVFRSTEREPLNIVLMGPSKCGKTFLRARMDIETPDGPARILYPYFQADLHRLQLPRVYTLSLETSRLPVQFRPGEEHFPVRIQEVPGLSFKQDSSMRMMAQEADAIILCFNIKDRNSFDQMKAMASEISRLSSPSYMLLNAMSYGSGGRDDALTQSEIREASPCRKIVVCDATRMNMVLRLFHDAGNLALQSRIDQLRSGMSP